MSILENHSAFNSVVVRNGIKIYENTSVRSYIMESKIKKAVRVFYESMLQKYGEFEKYKREFRALTGKPLPSLAELELRIERMSVVKMEAAMNAMYDVNTEECIKVLVGAVQPIHKKEEPDMPIADEPAHHPFNKLVSKKNFKTWHKKP